jgi:hypothetical protein
MNETVPEMACLQSGKPQTAVGRHHSETPTGVVGRDNVNRERIEGTTILGYSRAELERVATREVAPCG